MGSNIGNRGKNLISAINALRNLCSTQVIQVSKIYETAPFEVPEQPNFLNCCVKLLTDLSPHELLGACLGIETALGRIRESEYAPRIIDIDLLLYEDEEISSPNLILPHPQIRRRAFVLLPLNDLYPQGTAMSFNFSNDFQKVDSTGIVNVFVVGLN
ncbi:MAG: 2-amino-4-hydroxy-6-hydroxymethyldihydropteridine diphosphokinase [Clostridia bacterium]|nr:2-amino-4-hydroxy-6-hydroxymethyldihydropteridine diphosphokinase [Clostridia bacterium]